MQQNKSPQGYIDDRPEWKTGLNMLRERLCSTELEESIKWGAPCYMLAGKSVVSIAAFKSYFGLWFYQGALIDDPDGHLTNAQEGKTQAMRQLRYQRAQDIDLNLVDNFLKQAIDIEKSGAKVPTKKKKTLTLCTELEEVLKADLKECFSGLTPGRQREYNEYIVAAKQESTRLRRIEKILPLIRAGQGLHDKYR